MTKLNHINLTSVDTPELTRFFESCFGFRLLGQRGAGKFSVLMGTDGFVLTLMHGEAATYPANFHVGFLVESADEVLRLRAGILEAGFEAPEAAVFSRGGPKTFGFYCHAPGGVMVEVSAAAE